MALNFFCLAVLLQLSALVLGLPAELGVPKCKVTDAECLKSSMQIALPKFFSGIPARGVDKQDPLQLGTVAFDISGLQFNMKEGQVKGMKNAIIDDAKIDMERKIFKVRFHLDAIVKGHYKAGGRLLILPIEGDGEFKLKVKNMHVMLRMPFTVEDGHLKILKHSFEFDVKDSAHFTLENLFNGNKELSDTLHTFLNGNWQPVLKEFGPPLISAASDEVVRNIRQYLATASIEELFDV